MSLLEELKRRNVFRVAIAYIVLSWLMAQIAELLLQTFGAPDWVLKTLLAFFLIGFPFALFFAWAFELTPEGIKKEKDVDRSQSITRHTGRKLDYAIITIGGLLVGVGWSCINVASTALLSDTTTAGERGRAVGTSDAFGGCPTYCSLWRWARSPKDWGWRRSAFSGP